MSSGPSSAYARSATAVERAPRGRTVRPVAALVGLAGAQFVVTLNSSIVNVALPSIRSDLGLGDTAASWVVNAYLVTFAGLMLLGGRLSDIRPRRAVFVIGAAVFTLAATASAFAGTGPQLVAARAVQGVGGALMAPAALAIAMSIFSGRERARALAVWGGVSGAGGVAGVLLGGLLSDTLGWPWVFLLNVPVGVLAIVIVLRSVPPMAATAGAFDLGGAVSITTATAALVLGVVQGPRAGWTVTETLAPLLTAGLALAAFVAAERRSTAPLVPLDTFTRARLMIGTAVMVLLGGVMVGLFYYLPQYQQNALGMSATVTSLSQLPLAAAVTAAGFGAARVASLLGGQRRALTLALALLLAGLLWLTPAPTDIGVAGLVGPFLLVGAGLGLAFVYVTGLVVAEAAPHEVGLVSGLVNAARQLGGSLGLAGLVAVAAASAAGGTGSGPDFTPVFIGAAALGALALGLALLPSSRRHS